LVNIQAIFQLRMVIIMNDLLLVGGIAVAGASVFAGIVAIIAFGVSKRKINAKLDNEYGKKP